MADQPSPRRRFQLESPEARAALWSFRISLVLIGASIGGLFSAAVAALSAAVGPTLMPLSWIALQAAISGLMLGIGQWLRRGRMRP